MKSIWEEPMEPIPIDKIELEYIKLILRLIDTQLDVAKKQLRSELIKEYGESFHIEINKIHFYDYYGENYVVIEPNNETEETKES